MVYRLQFINGLVKEHTYILYIIMACIKYVFIKCYYM